MDLEPQAVPWGEANTVVTDGKAGQPLQPEPDS
jgi:hypothetical protein